MLHFFYGSLDYTASIFVCLFVVDFLFVVGFLGCCCFVCLVFAVVFVVYFLSFLGDLLLFG